MDDKHTGGCERCEAKIRELRSLAQSLQSRYENVLKDYERGTQPLRKKDRRRTDALWRRLAHLNARVDLRKREGLPFWIDSKEAGALAWVLMDVLGQPDRTGEFAERMALGKQGGSEAEVKPREGA